MERLIKQHQNQKNKADFKDSKYATGEEKICCKGLGKKGSGNIHVNGLKI